MAEENQNEEELELHEYLDEEEPIVLQTHTKINTALSGSIDVMEETHVEVLLETKYEMVADLEGLIHGGFIFSAADFAAMAVVNEPNVVLVGSDCQFLSPVKVGDEVRFKADLRHKDGRKRNVSVEAFVHDIKVFQGEFKTVVTDKHVLKLKLLDEEEN